MSTAITSNRTMSATIIPDNALLKVGNDGDGVIVLSSAGVAANTALTSVLIGTPVAQAVAANSLLISNITASGDIAMYGNKGGHSQQFLFYDSSAGNLSLGAASGGTIGLYVAGTVYWTVSATQITAAAGQIIASGATNTNTLLFKANDTTFITLTTGATDTMTLGAFTASGSITFNAALDIVMPADTIAALELSDGTKKLLAFDTRTSADNTAFYNFSQPNHTIANVAGTSHAGLYANDYTITLSATTTVTALRGLQMWLLGVTINQSGGAVTVSEASTLHLYPVVAGASVTITNNYIISTTVSGCYLTAAGVWTSASNRASKTDIKPVDLSLLPGLLDTIEVVSFRKREGEQGQVRFGIIADDAPECMRMGDGQGAAAIYMAGVALYAVKSHEARIRELEAELALLKGA